MKVITLTILTVALLATPARAAPYAWTHGAVLRTLHNIAPPPGFHRIALEPRVAAVA